MTRSDVMVRAAPWLYTAIMFIVWEAAVRLFNIPTFFLPPPTAIANAFVEYWTPIYRHSLYTLSTTMIGWLPWTYMALRPGRLRYFTRNTTSATSTATNAMPVTTRIR